MEAQNAIEINRPQILLGEAQQGSPPPPAKPS
jgi:hypothetical protein